MKIQLEKKQAIFFYQVLHKHIFLIIHSMRHSQLFLFCTWSFISIKELVQRCTPISSHPIGQFMQQPLLKRPGERNRPHRDQAGILQDSTNICKCHQIQDGFIQVPCTNVWTIKLTLNLTGSRLWKFSSYHLPIKYEHLGCKNFYHIFLVIKGSVWYD